MRRVYIVLVACLLSASQFVNAQSGTFHQFKMETITGDTLDLMNYFGKKVMVVNTASFCGYTPQFEDLQNLYDVYHQYNFEIIGFPCNDFGSQDPGSDSAILDFCTANYGVTFQMMHKIDIVSGDTAPLYKWLQRGDLNGVQNASVGWNFNKFLIDEAGHWVAHYGSAMDPTHPTITNWIMSPSVLPPNDGPSDFNSDQQSETYVATPTGINLVLPDNVFEQAEIFIFAADGKLVQHVSNVAWENGTHIDANGLVSGVYLLKAKTESGIKTIRFAVTP